MNKDFLNFYSISVFSIYSFVLMLTIFHHEMWMDESHHWLLAKSSANLSDLISNYKYDGHPILWELILYIISRFTNDVTIVQIIHGLIMMSASFVFFRYCPFSFKIRCLVLFSYFFLFEYGVLARNYSLILLFAFLFVKFWNDNNYSASILSLSFLANTHLFGAVFSGILFLLVVYELWQRNDVSKFIPALTFYCLLALFSIYIIIPPLDHPLGPSTSFLFDFTTAADGIMLFFKACFPFPNLMTDYYWNTNFFTANLKWLIAPFAILIWILPYYLPWVKRQNYFIWLGIASFMLVFNLTTGLLGSVRYGGLILIFLMICIWMDYKNSHWNWKDLVGLRGFVIKVALILLCFTQLLSAIIFVSTDLFREFSSSKRLSKMILELGYEDLPLVSNAFCSGIGFLNYIDQDIYFTLFEEECQFCEWQKLSHEKYMSFQSIESLSHNFLMTEEYMHTNDYKEAIYINRIQTKNDINFYNGSLLIEPVFINQERGALIRLENFDIYKISLKDKFN